MNTEPAKINGFRHSVQPVNAETARRWLKHNDRNRRVNHTAVARYRSDMRNGRWAFAADPIRFDTEGRLIDGQHRLMALAGIDGLTLPMLVVRGLDGASQAAMDQGHRRSAADQLSLHSVPNSSFIAAGVRAFLIHDEGLLFRDNKMANSVVSTTRIAEWVANHPDEVEWLNKNARNIRANMATPSIAAASALIFGRIDRAEATEFFELLAHGAGIGSPITTLDKRLQRLRSNGVSYPHRDVLAMFIQAWNSWRGGRSISKFQRPSGGWRADTYPKAV